MFLQHIRHDHHQGSKPLTDIPFSIKHILPLITIIIIFDVATAQGKDDVTLFVCHDDFNTRTTTFVLSLP